MKTIKLNGIDEEIYFTTSKDGLPIYIWKNEYAKSFYISLNVKYGSIDTEFTVGSKRYKVPDGIAHFMEHLKFNVKKGVTANDLFDKLGSDINAFTTFKYTSYLVYGNTNFDDNLKNLLYYVYNPYFTKELIKKEKGIIISEINMGKDQVYNNLYFTFNKCIYENSKYRNLITGEAEDVKNTTLEDIKLVYDVFYHPKNMFLVVTGNVNPYSVEKIVNEELEKKNIGKFLEPSVFKPKEPKNVAVRDMVMEANVEVEKAKVGLKIERSNFKGVSQAKLNALFNIIISNNFGDTSVLKEELLQSGLISFMNATAMVLDKYVIVDITIESNYMDEAIDRIVKTLNNLEITEEDLKRKVNSLIATLILSYEDVENVNNIIQNHIIYYDTILQDLKDIYEHITLKDAEEVIKGIDTKEMTIIKVKKK